MDKMRDIIMHKVEFKVSEEKYNQFEKERQRYKYIRYLDKKNHLIWHHPALKYEDSTVNINMIADDRINVEEEAIKNVLIDQLHKCLKSLSSDELYLITQIFFMERSEREIAQKIGISHTAVGKRVDKILAKLKKMIEI